MGPRRHVQNRCQKPSPGPGPGPGPSPGPGAGPDPGSGPLKGSLRYHDSNGNRNVGKMK